jgi:hypothetical protein
MKYISTSSSVAPPVSGTNPYKYGVGEDGWAEVDDRVDARELLQELGHGAEDDAPGNLELVVAEEVQPAAL